jgi:hypothetical protein
VTFNVRGSVIALTLAVVPCIALAQDPPTGGGGQEPPAGGGGRGARAQEPEIRPYDRVITKNAKTDEGIFTVHRIKDRVYYEIPKDRLGREFLWVSQIAKTTLGAGYGGQAAGNRVIKSERRGERILLRAIRTTSSPTPARRSRSTTEFDETRANDVCWPDYAVKPRRGAR